MTSEEYAAIFTPYLVMMGKHFDSPMHRAYVRVLQPVPAQLFAAVIERLMGEARQFVPRAGELKALCEEERQKLIAAHPFQNCIHCSRDGWLMVPLQNDVGAIGYFAQRCSCFTAHWAKLEGLGVTAQPLLVAAREQVSE